MPAPDYEGLDWSESDQDEPEATPSIKPQDQKEDNVNMSATMDIRVAKNDAQILSSESNTAEKIGQVEEGEKGGDSIATRHVRAESNENDAGALNDLLDDYNYTSQPNTPGAPHAGFTPVDPIANESLHSKVENPNMSPVFTSTVTNIRRIDANPAPKEPSSLIPSPPATAQAVSQPAKPIPSPQETDSFMSDVTKSLDPIEPPQIITVEPISSTQPSENTASETKSAESETKPPAETLQAKDYWAQMRAQLKAKRTAGNEMSRNSSNKTETVEGDSKSPSPLPRTSNESSRSTGKPSPTISDGRSGSFTSYTPLPPGVKDGRSGSFTSYTPLPANGRTGSFTNQTPRYPETRRPSIPGIQGIPYGRPRPTIDTGRQISLTSSTIEPAMRRGSGSDTARPNIELRGSGNRSASNSPVMGSLPLSGPPRPSSRSRNREPDIVGNMPLPVFAPREGLPDIRGGERTGRPQSPAGRGLQTGRPQSPARDMLPARGPLSPGRPQSPSRAMSPGRGPPPNTRSQSPSRTVSPMQPGVYQANRTPSPLKEKVSDEPKPGPSPTKTIGIGGTNAQTVTGTTPSPPNNVPVNIPTAVATSSKEIIDPVAIPTPPPQPPPQTQTSQPLSPRPQKVVSLPVVPPMTIPPSVREPDPIPSPSSQASERTADSGTVPTEKRTTVLLQAAGRQKESLPPLPTAPPPPIPSSTAAVPSERALDPAQRLQTTDEPSSPLIPPPRAPILESKLMKSQSSDSFDDTPPSPPVQSQAKNPNRLSGTIIPMHSHMTPALSSTFDQGPSTPTKNPPPAPAHATPIQSTPVKGRGLGSPIVQLPELDMSRPITWGPLAFGETPQQTPEKTRMDPLGHVDEEESESDWEKEHNDDEAVEKPKAETLPGAFPVDSVDVQVPEDETKKTNEEGKDAVEQSTTDTSAVRTSATPDTVVKEQKDPRAVTENAPDEDVLSEEDAPIGTLDKGKQKELYSDSSPVTPRPLSRDTSIYPEAVPRSKFIDRDITSFFMPRDSPRSEAATLKAKLPPLQTRPIPPPPSLTVLPLDHLPSFMSAQDIPTLSTVAQRVGAYQSRRSQITKADSGLRGWLLQVQQGRPPSFPQQFSPEIRRMSQQSYGTPSSPSSTSLPFAEGGKKVTRKMISKIKMGGQKLGAATKKMASGAGDKHSSTDMAYARRSSELSRHSPPDTIVYPSDPISGTFDSPKVPYQPQPSPQFGRETEGGANLARGRAFSDASSTVGLGLSSQQPNVRHTPSQSTSSFTNYPQVQGSKRPQSPYYGRDPAMGPVSKKESKAGGGRHAFSASISGGKVSNLFGNPKAKHNSDEYGQSSSPKQKSKFSKFMNDLSQQSITGTKQSTPPSQSRIMGSPPPPPPPDKTQFRATSEGSAGKLKGFLSDLNSRDITGAKAGEKSPRQNTSAGAVGGRGGGGAGGRGVGGGLKGFMAELSKRDITGATEQDRLAAQRRRGQEATHQPAPTTLYDETASDWEVKLETMEDVLPHIRRDKLAEALMQAGGDEQRAIGLAVINSR